MAHQKPTRVSADQSVEQAFAQILRANLTLTRKWEPVVLAGEDPEGIHQLRVCLRRMRSALGVFRPAIPRKVTRTFSKRMRAAAKTLDRSRDLDVYIEENLASKGKKRNSQMRRLAMKHRDRAYDQVTDFIRGERYLKLCAELEHWVETGAWRVGLSDKQIRVLEGNILPFASEVLDCQRARVLQDGRDIDRLDSEALHQLRIDCKKLRYAAEFFAPLYGTAMRDLVGHLKALQDILGTLHDTAVLPGLQKDLLKGEKKGNLKRYAGRLVAKRGKQATALRKTLRKSWDAFCNAEPPWRDTGAHRARGSKAMRILPNGQQQGFCPAQSVSPAAMVEHPLT